jgi:hypothetical protein
MQINGVRRKKVTNKYYTHRLKYISNDVFVCLFVDVDSFDCLLFPGDVFHCSHYCRDLDILAVATTSTLFIWGNQYKTANGNGTRTETEQIQSITTPIQRRHRIHSGGTGSGSRSDSSIRRTSNEGMSLLSLSDVPSDSIAIATSNIHMKKSNIHETKKQPKQQFHPHRRKV